MAAPDHLNCNDARLANPLTCSALTGATPGQAIHSAFMSQALVNDVIAIFLLLLAVPFLLPTFATQDLL